jgi:hypothetical protein
MATFDPSNSKNEFDYVGQIHNQIVSAFVETTEGEKLTNTEVLEKVKSITLANDDYKKLFEAEYYELAEEHVNEGLKDFPNEFRNMIDSFAITSKAKTIFNELLSNTFEIENTEISFAKYRDYVLSLEDFILNKSTLEKREKDVILCSTSVARYSSYLWVGSNPQPEAKKHLGWVIAGDVVGGILGGIFGGVVGAISGASGGSSLVHTINESK